MGPAGGHPEARPPGPEGLGASRRAARGAPALGLYSIRQRKAHQCALGARLVNPVEMSVLIQNSIVVQHIGQGLILEYYYE